MLGAIAFIQCIVDELNFNHAMTHYLLSVIIVQHKYQSSTLSLLYRSARYATGRIHYLNL